MINFESGNLYWRMLDDLFIKFGFPKAQFGRNTDIHPGRKYCNTEKVNFTYVDEGDVLEYGGYHFQPILTPGHTPGHMCLYDAAVSYTHLDVYKRQYWKYLEHCIVWNCRD